MVLTKHIFDVIIFVKQNVNVNILREITKMRKSALITLFAIMISVFCGAAVVANASGAENESAIADALGNGRVTTVVNEDDSVKLDLEVTDGTPSSTRAYYMYNVILTATGSACISGTKPPGDTRRIPRFVPTSALIKGTATALRTWLKGFARAIITSGESSV